ncbi:TPA: hypothetical protein DDZ86_04695 [Candidatus Dependentiae bacterium]|nr:hypothetical protein [Candidatus Dependentiae bacterium]
MESTYSKSLLVQEFEALRFVFGDKKNSCTGDALQKSLQPAALGLQEPFKTVAETLKVPLIFPRQVHGVEVLALKTKANVQKALEHHTDADIISTSLEGVGIGVLTADCLPLILYDPEVHACAVVHAGWKGTLKNVACEALEHLGCEYGTSPEHVLAFFGPCAHVEKYSASTELLKLLSGSPFRENVLEDREGVIYFNLPKMNELQLRACGLLAENIHREFCKDTITNYAYWSYRRDGESAGRQLTVAMLAVKE